MEDKDRFDIPSDAKINASSPGTLAIERFKLIMALENNDMEIKEDNKENTKH